MKAQSGIEYMMIIGFVTFAISVILITAYFYIDMSRDRIRINQIETLAAKIVNSAESVFYAGQPSQATVTIYVPTGVESIEPTGYDLIITASTSSGVMKRAFTSKVMIEGNINPSQGSKRLVIKALSDKVSIIQKLT